MRLFSNLAPFGIVACMVRLVIGLDYDLPREVGKEVALTEDFIHELLNMRTASCHWCLDWCAFSKRPRYVRPFSASAFQRVGTRIGLQSNKPEQDVSRTSSSCDTIGADLTDL